MLPNPILTLGELEIYMYGVMLGVGIVGVFLVLYLYGTKRKVKPAFLDFAFYTGFGAIAFGFLAAALFQATYNYIQNPERGFSLKGGITVIGGLIGGIAFFVGVYWLYRLYHYKKGSKPAGSILDILSIAACCITIAQGFGRIGCFFAGCCHGKATDAAHGLWFPRGGVIREAGYYIPTQLYEAIFMFLLFGVLSLLVLKWGNRYCMPIYLIAYGIERFILEYFRGDDRGEFVGGISPSQFWSVGFVLGGVILGVLLCFFYKKKDKEKEAVAQ